MYMLINNDGSRDVKSDGFQSGFEDEKMDELTRKLFFLYFDRSALVVSIATWITY